jgi:hypothetical protein
LVGGDEDFVGGFWLEGMKKLSVDFGGGGGRKKLSVDFVWTEWLGWFFWWFFLLFLLYVLP